MAVHAGVRRLFRPFTRVLCAVLAASCASNPYPTLAPVRPDHSYGGPKVVSIANAMQRLGDMRAEYRAKRSADFDRQQRLGAGVLGVGALALGLGAYGAHRDAITGAALGGATAYQFGTWNAPPTRNDIYALGIEALDCGEAIMTPALAATSQHGAVQQARIGLERRQQEALDARAGLQTLVVAGSLTGRIRLAYQAVIDSASAELARSGRANASASEWSGMIEGAGQSLSTYVTMVNSDVEKALQKSVADVSQLLERVQGLATYLKLFGGVAASGGQFSSRGGLLDSVTVELDTSNEAGGRAVAALLAAQHRLTFATDHLDALLAGSKLVDPRARLAGCRIDLANAMPKIEVDPAEVELFAGEEYEKHVNVLNGGRDFDVSLQDVSPVGITVKKNGVDTFGIAVDARSVPGTYVIRVSDRLPSPSSARMTVRLVARPSQAGTPSDASECAPGWKPVQICLLQKFLKLEMTGRAGPETCKALAARSTTRVVDEGLMRQVYAEFGLPKDAGDAEMRLKLAASCPAPPTLSAPAATGLPPAIGPAARQTPLQPANAARPASQGVCKLVSATTSCPVKGARCESECAMSAKKVGELRVALGLSATPAEFDGKLRTALAKKQKALGIAPQRGDYTDALAKALGLGSKP